jgi:hypothetical protein
VDNFGVIYKILRTLERFMDAEEFDFSLIQAGALGVSEARWARLMGMLIENGYICGVRATVYDGKSVPIITPAIPSITIKGLGYLCENPIMQKFTLDRKND